MTSTRFLYTAPLAGSPLSPWSGSGQPISGPLRADPAAAYTFPPLAFNARLWPSQANYRWGRFDGLTTDLNPKPPGKDDQSELCAINCANLEIESLAGEALTDDATDLLRASIAPASARALRGDLDQFAAWGGTLPAPPAMIARYIAEHAGQHAVATIQRRLASISKAHEMAGLPNPCRAEIVRAVDCH